MIVFKESDTRVTASTVRMVSMLSAMFGDDFWDNVIIGVTWWGFDEQGIASRKSKGVTKESFIAQKRDGLLKAAMSKSDNQEVKRTIAQLKGVFIDAFYNSTDRVKPDDRAAVEFQTNTKELFDFAKNKKPFHCKDIKTVLNELADLEKKKLILEEKRQELVRQQADAEGLLTSCQMDLNNAEDLHETCEKKRTNSQTDSDKAKDLLEKCENKQTAAEAVLGVGMFATGLMVGVLLVLCCSLYCTNRVRVVFRLFFMFLSSHHVLC